MTAAYALQTSIFGFGLWLGLYLLARRPAPAGLRLAGAGLVAYALALALDLLSRAAPPGAAAAELARWHWLIVLLPASLWSGTLVHLAPQAAGRRDRLTSAWSYGLLALNLAFILIGIGTDWIVRFTPAGPQPGPGYPVAAVFVLLPLAAALLWVISGALAGPPPRRQVAGVLLAATIFFALGAALLIFPLGWLPRAWVLPAVSLDLAALGLAVALLDAFDEGEALLPDLARSLAGSLVAALVFGGLVWAASLWSGGLTLPMLTLLLAVVGAAIAGQVFADPLQAAVDRLVFARLPRLRQARSDLRATASALARADDTLDLNSLDDEEFARLTRRAISLLGDLSRLASSPLARLPVVEARLAQRGAKGDALERAVELKAVLAESILRLKPQDKGDFGASDEWRHYNALYFPYVAGLKPYSRRADHNGLGPAEREALEWFRGNVPERTLYNWQVAAARLVAQSLRDRET